LENGKDYSLYRYVDDYFLFYNDESIQPIVLNAFRRELEEYKLTISNEKTVIIERPFITNISQAKIRIDQLINKRLKYQTNELIQSDDSDLDEDKDSNDVIDEDVVELDFDINIINKKLEANGYYLSNFRKFILEYKDILETVNLEPKDILNSTLGCIFSRLERELKKFDKDFKYIMLYLHSSSVDKDLKIKCEEYILKKERELARYLIDVVDISFHLFSLCRRLNTSLKLLRILNAIIIYLKGVYETENIQRFSCEIKDAIFREIYLEVHNILSRESCNDYAQLEVLYLLIVMRNIDSKYTISAKELAKYIGFLDNEPDKFYLNAISVYVVLYYIGNKKCYTNLKDRLVRNILNRISDKGNTYPFMKDSEFAMLAIDLACCPYLNRKDKIAILKSMKLGTSINKLLAYAQHNNHMFVKWTGLDITKELAAKISQEVYA
jgi:hypothetical protein